MQQTDFVVHIVDDEESVRKSLAFLLTARGFTVRVHSMPTEVLANLPTDGKACLLTDVRMPELNGVELMLKIAQLGIKIPTIVITGHGDIKLAVEAMKAGAVDFIEKPFADEILIEAIHRAAQELEGSGTFVDVAKLRERFTKLSGRENEVLRYLIAGLPNKSIAHILAISSRTVEVHRANIMKKTLARSLPELVRMALETGIELKQ